MHVGHLWKKIVIYINDGSHAQLLIKLRHDNIKQRRFFRMLTQAYLEDHPLMRELIFDLNKEKISKNSKIKVRKDQKKKEQTIKDFALNPDEIESIFDAIEKESSDL